MVSKPPNDDNQLIPERYPQSDLFIFDVGDAVLKDIMQSMEHLASRNTMPLEANKTWDGILSSRIMERVGRLNLDTDKYVLEQEWRSWLGIKGINPDNPDGHFYTFCKNRAARQCA